MPESTPSPVPNQAAQTPPAPPVTPPDVQAAADAAALAAAQEQTAKLAAAADTLARCVKAYSGGELAMKAGRLEAGLLADVYVAQRVALGGLRTAAITAVEGELAKYATERVDASNLIRVHHAHRLLNATLENGPETTVPYGHYLRVFCQLVERVVYDGGERWVLLPGFERAAAAVFRDCVVNGWTQAECHPKVQTIQREYAIAQQDKAAADDDAAKAAATETAKAFELAKAEQKAAEAADKAAKDAAMNAAADKRAELTAAAEKARADKLAAQRKAAELNAQRNAAEKAAKDAAARKAAADKAAQKATTEPTTTTRKPTTPTTPPADSGRTPQHNPLATAKLATAKDLAESIRDQICANPSPVFVLQELAKCFDWRESDAKAFVAGLAANEHKHAVEFAWKLAETLPESLPQLPEAPKVGTATAAA